MNTEKTAPQRQIRDKLQKNIEKKFGKPIYEIMYDFYVVQELGNRIIASKLGIGSTTVLTWLRALQIPIRPKSTLIVPTLFCLECSKPLTAAQHRIHRHNSNTGIYCSRICYAKKRSKQFPVEELHTLYQGGLLIVEIAKMYNTTPDTLRKVFKEAGIPIKRQFPRYWTGKNLSEKTKAKIREATQRQFSDPENRRRAAERTAKQIKEGRTGKAFNKLESAFAQILDGLDIEYIWQYQVKENVFDFYLPQTNTLIECHGTFWHADPRFYSAEILKPVQQRNIINDKRKALVALKAGYDLVCFWEYDINKNSQLIYTQLNDLL